MDTRVLWKKLPVVAISIAVVIAVGPVAAAPPPGAGDPVFMFQGRGRAHGVGMCMDGVYYRAQEGWGYHDILNYYYTNISYSSTDENRQIKVKGRDGQIRQLSIHDYLYRLQEEPDNYPMEELKALYVAARTYLLSVMARNKHTAEGFDICSSGECCQAFDENKDISKYPNNCAAVDATRGETMVYDGQPITAAYCGSCGGHTENNEDVWGGSPIPYLRGKPDDYCQYSPRYAWDVSYHKSELEALFNSSPETEIGTLAGIDLSERTPGGRVKKAVIAGSLGSKTISGGTLQQLLGFQSTLFFLVSSNFDEYILVLNPNTESAVCTFTFMQPDGTTTDEIFEIAPGARFSLKVNDYVQFEEVSTRIVSDRPVIAERALYYSYKDRNDGSDSLGVTQTGTRWYFAEGFTGESFDTYVLVQNPEPETADIKFTFMLPGGRNVEQTAQIQGNSRLTIHVDDVPGLEDTDVSTLVESTNGVGIVSDRSVYFDRAGCDGGHCAPGVPAPEKSWYLAEGYTGGRFDTYVLLMNPGDGEAKIKATFMKEGGNTVEKTYDVAAHSRYTIPVDYLEGFEDVEFSTRLESLNGAGFIAERAMYFDYNGKTGGSASPGVVAPSETWYLAEGYTGGDFDTWVLVQNPEDADARVKVTFNTPGGSGIEREYTIQAHSRYTIGVDGIPGLEDVEVSTTVHSENGVKVIAERAMYFDYTGGGGDRSGGHSSNGVVAPSNTWYFAEGYTGL